MELCTPVLCRPSCNFFRKDPLVKNPLEDSEIFHSGEGGDVERWLELRIIPLCLRLLVSYFLLLFIIHTFVKVHLAFYNCFYSIIFIINLYSSQ